MKGGLGYWLLKLLCKKSMAETETAKTLLKEIAISEYNFLVKKAMLLRLIKDHMVILTFNESVLDALELLEQLYRLDGSPITAAMTAAYCAVAVESTINCLLSQRNKNRAYVCAVHRIWRDRVPIVDSGERSLRMSDEMNRWRSDIEASLSDLELRKRIASIDTRKDAFDKLEVYLDEAWANMGRSLIQKLAWLIATELASLIVKELAPDVEESPEESQNDARLQEGNNCKNGCKRAESSVSWSKVDFVEDLEVQQPGEFLERSSLTKEPIDNQDARESSKRQEPIENQDVPESSTPQEPIENQDAPESSTPQEPIENQDAHGSITHQEPIENQDAHGSITHQEPIENQDARESSTPQEKFSTPQVKFSTSQEKGKRSMEADPSTWTKMDPVHDHEVEDGESLESIHNQSKDTHPSNQGKDTHQTCPRASQSVNNDDHQPNLLDDEQGATSSLGGKHRLSSPKKRKHSPLKKYVPTQISKRRKPKKWSRLEEEALSVAVDKFGIGKWKLILNAHKDTFEGRTEVDLKDKWRNMMRYADD